MNPEYPVYVVSKGRWKQRTTTRVLDRMNVPYTVIVEANEYHKYLEHYDEDQLMILPQEYKNNYDTCDGFGFSKSIGAGSARNFVWDMSQLMGYKRHWVMDDNIEGFYRLNKNRDILVESGTILKCAEDFVDRYSNVYVAGLNYRSFVKSTDPVPPFVKNTRIYSCLLIQNDINYRWRGRYNEDTDLSLRVLKDGYCTVQFNAFLAGKITTQRMRGGNSKEFYDHEGTLAKSQMIVDLHPDVSKISEKFGRVHHHVDYRSFKTTKLKPIVEVKQGVNNYGMKLINLNEAT